MSIYKHNFKLTILASTFLFLYCSNSYAKGRLLFATGANYIDYKETYSIRPSLNKEFSETATYLKFDARYFPFGRGLSLGANFKYIGPIINSSTEDEVTYMNYSAYGGVSMSGRPVKVKLTGEYYVNSMSANSTFGYQDMDGYKFSIILFQTLGNFKMQIKYPFWNSVADVTEYSGNLSYHFGKFAEKTPLALSKGFVLKLTYKQFKITSTGIDEIEVNTQTMGVNLGYNW